MLKDMLTLINLSTESRPNDTDQFDHYIIEIGDGKTLEAGKRSTMALTASTFNPACVVLGHLANPFLCYRLSVTDSVAQYWGYHQLSLSMLNILQLRQNLSLCTFQVFPSSVFSSPKLLWFQVIQSSEIVEGDGRLFVNDPRAITTCGLSPLVTTTSKAYSLRSIRSFSCAKLKPMRDNVRTTRRLVRT